MALTAKLPAFGTDWHVFDFDGKHLFFSVDRSRVLQITDEPLFDLLRRHEQARAQGPVDIWQRLEACDWSAQVKGETRAALIELAPYTVRSPDLPPYVPEVGEDLTPQDITMSAITLVMSGACNLRCRYCYTGLQVEQHPYSMMPREIAEQAVDLMVKHFSPKAQNLRATFFGGEPLLNFQVVKATIEHVKRRAAEMGKGYSFSLTTNGTLLTEPIIRYLHQNRCAILVSIDGPAEVHDRHRVFPDGQGSHKIVLERTRMLRRLTGSLFIRATQAPGGLSVRELCKYFAQLGATPPFAIGAIMMTGSNNGDGAFGSSQETVSRVVHEYDEIRPLVYADLMAGRTPPHDCLTDGFKRMNCDSPLLYRYHCTALGSSTAVGTDGTLYPCHRFWPMDDYAIGTTADDFDVKRYVALLRKYHTGVTSACTGCWARFLCLGLCSRFRADEKGGYNAPNPPECEVVCRSWEQTVGYFVKASVENPQRLRQLCKSSSQAATAGTPEEEPSRETSVAALTP